MRVLFIVDNSGWTKNYEAALQREYDVEVVAVGRDVPMRIRQFRPHVLVLDVVLPHLHGIHVAELLREDWPQLPIVFTTEDLDHRTMLPPMTEYLEKPYSPDTLIDSINRAAVCTRRSS
ncbi:MAG TPA: response regulator [Thermoanaerobaculia bacterium]|nr:response regulator [Thermoanaerobaculia bacterium]